MIYYYFGGNEGLYRKVIEKTHVDTQQGELALDQVLTNPQEAKKKLISFTFNYHKNYFSFIRLVIIVNIHRGMCLGDK